MPVYISSSQMVKYLYNLIVTVCVACTQMEGAIS